MPAKAGRERRCVVEMAVKPEDALLRVGLAPDGQIVADVAAKLPGRGAWVSAQRNVVDQAVAKRAFNRAFGQPVQTPSDLADQFEALLKTRALDLLGLARRSGRLACGHDAVRLALKASPHPVLRFEASDGARDGREKLDRLAYGLGLTRLPVVTCFDAAQLGMALGRSGMVHLALAGGSDARALVETLQKLSGFCAVYDQIDASKADLR